jgi:hypothetical protein
MLLLGYNKDFGGSMQRSKYSFVLDLQSTESQICLIATQGDTGRAFHIRLSDGGETAEIDSETTAKLFIESPLGTVLEEDCVIEKVNKDDEKSEYYVYYPFNQYTCKYEGMHKCQLELASTKEDFTISAAQFGLFVGAKKKELTTGI